MRPTHRHLPLVPLGPAVLAGLVVAVATPAGADVIDVPTPATPTIQSAILVASDGDTIVVQPRDPDAPFPFDAYYESIDLDGKAITIRSVDPEDPAIVATTVINAAGQGGSVVLCNSGEGPGSVLEGFTLTGGAALDATPYGGGLNAFDGSPTVRHCVFTGNMGVHGGAAYSNTGSPTFEDCTFSGNTALVNGAGFSGAGGAIYANGGVTCVRCTFEGNHAEFVGGALFLSSDPSSLTDCLVVGNTALGDGGGLYVQSVATLSLVRCRVAGNEGDSGGGVYSANNATHVTMENCVVHDNQAAGAGAGIAAGTATLRHCTVAGNTAAGSGGGTRALGAGVVTITNSIVWGNMPDGISGDPSDLLVTHSNDQSGVEAGSNINADPLFVSLAGRDLRLLAGSPVIDRGDSTVLVGPNPVDLDGGPCAVDDPASPDQGVPVYGLTVDMGAYEFAPEGVVPTCPGDTNGDGAVDVVDLTTLILAWGMCP